MVLEQQKIATTNRGIIMSSPIYTLLPLILEKLF
jgi:hypothetical protein